MGEPGRDDATLHRFFDELGPERGAQITHISADLADWIARVVAARVPQAVRCADPFHVVAWAIDALDVERRRAWNEPRGRHRISPSLRRPRSSGQALSIARARYALWKNPDDLTDRQRHQLDWIATTDRALWRAYLLKEGLRYVFAVKGDEGKEALARWLSWAQRCRLPSFMKLRRRILTHRAAIEATLEHQLSQGLVESTNGKIRLLTESRSVSTAPSPSSHWRCLPLAAIRRVCRAEIDPRMEPKHPFWAR